MRLLSVDELKTAKGIHYSKPHLYRLMKAGKFPQPIRLGERRIAWPESEINSWLESKIAERETKLKAEREAKLAEEANLIVA